ncbi:apolipoprotein N-acyltransferase [Homoserinimonas aerilata]|uniref:Apolipoprotein N-acyltransferase n=1 Tax=Homoserinimonas aerilata TaxID=1162970 RepID=A0A542YJ47_9MICO|nr:apolipoprotein N-acyltransferase [Homoserinimonas aerilata]TQL48109.1 apolipoprotein N-acyltransferase [Homoserinimonas aerilata]
MAFRGSRTRGSKAGDRGSGRRLWLSLLTAVVGGALLAGAFPSLGWWPLAFVGTGLLLWSLDGRGIGGALLTGLLGGFSFYGLHIVWLTIYLGPVPWLALTGLEALFFALGAVLLALAWRFVPRAVPGVWGRMLLLPAVLAGIWTLREGITAVWPYGGFSWGRLAFSQSQSSLGDLAAWLGASGLSFVVALIAAMLLQAIRELAVLRAGRAALAPTAAVLALALLAFLMPPFPVTVTSSIRVAAVQGNADAGLFAQREAGAILDDHLQATMPIIDESVDLVVWPENAADVNPLRYPRAAGVLDYVSGEMDAPLVVGTITDGPEDELFNSVLLWRSGEGSVAQYDKAHPVPFAEYLPDREFWYPLAPALFDLVPRDYTLGTRPNVFDIDGLLAGIAICFDIVDDGLLHEMIDGGAQIILAPTNNADFGPTDESVQQLAIARLRALEYGRTVVNTSTVGTSAIIAPDGGTIAELPTFEPGAMVEDVPLSDTVTPAAVIGRGVEWGLSAFGLGALLLALGLAVWRRGSHG